MTSLPASTEKALGLVIDLDICVGCHACAVACKEWNTAGASGPLSDLNPYGADVHGAWLNRVHSYEVDSPGGEMTLHFPRSCLHCHDAPCVTVCPTGASFKRSEDGIVLVDDEKCIGCGLCAWACPYGAREMDPVENVMRKCTLCVDRIYNETLDEADRIPACVRTCPTGARSFGDLSDPKSEVSGLVETRGGVALMPEQRTRPTNRYLPPRPRDLRQRLPDTHGHETACVDIGAEGFFGWVDSVLTSMGR